MCFEASPTTAGLPQRLRSTGGGERARSGEPWSAIGMPSCATWQPAGRAGLLPGNIIVALAEQPVGNAVAVEQILSRLRSHHPVPARIYRNGRAYEHMIDL
jgi:hypothetical protein